MFVFSSYNLHSTTQITPTFFENSNIIPVLGSYPNLYISLLKIGIDSNLNSLQEGHFVTVLLATFRQDAHQKHNSHNTKCIFATTFASVLSLLELVICSSRVLYTLLFSIDGGCCSSCCGCYCWEEEGV